MISDNRLTQITSKHCQHDTHKKESRLWNHRLIAEGRQCIDNLEEYILMGGFQGLKKAMSMLPQEIIAEVKASGLRGRGGAGFPAGIKWESVTNEVCATKFVVCNAAEGEPGTYKDRYLIQKNPYQLMEGILIACRAINAKQAVIGTKAKFLTELGRLRSAIKELEKAGIISEGYIEIFEGPDDYLFGEEKALVEAISGRGALPRIMPPYMIGIHETPSSPNPTIVNNVETLSNLPHIFIEGAQQYRQVGTATTPGTMIFTLSGDVKKPGMYELPLGTTLKTLLYDYGQGPKEGRTFKAVFSGVASAVITPDEFDTQLDFDAMKKMGSGLGSGGLIVFDDSVCMVRAALLFSKFLSQSSCGQCFPCSSGTAKATELLERLESGQGMPSDMDTIFRLCGKMTDQTRCYLPMQESILIKSIVRKFPTEFFEHLQIPCECKRDLILPRIKTFDEQSSCFYYDQ